MGVKTGNWRIYPSLTKAVQAALELVASSKTDERVLWVDGANRFDPYAILKLTQNPTATKKILQRVFISRPFTIYQLARLLEIDLIEAARRQNAKNVLIIGASSMFLDENVNEDERKEVWKKMVVQIHALPGRGISPLVLDYENSFTELAGAWLDG